MPEREWVGLGQQQEVTGHRQQVAEQQLDAARSYATRSHTHLWTVAILHRATDPLLDAYDGKSADLPMLDADTILMRPAVMCFMCEEPYESRLRRRKCPGEPS